MSTLLLWTIFAAPPACDWTFGPAAPAKPATVQPAERSTFLPAIGEGRIPPASVGAPVGASTCGNPLCPCGPACSCRNCCCGLTREAIMQRAAQLGVAESVTLPVQSVQRYAQPVYQQPRIVAPPVYYSPAYQPYYAVPYAAPAGGCPGGVCPLPGG